MLNQLEPLAIPGEAQGVADLSSGGGGYAIGRSTHTELRETIDDGQDPSPT